MCVELSLFHCNLKLNGFVITPDPWNHRNVICGTQIIGCSTIRIVRTGCYLWRYCLIGRDRMGSLKGENDQTSLQNFTYRLFTCLWRLNKLESLQDSWLGKSLQCILLCSTHWLQECTLTSQFNSAATSTKVQGISPKISIVIFFSLSTLHQNMCTDGY